MSPPPPGRGPAPRRVTRRAALRWGGRALLGAVAGGACAARPPSTTGIGLPGPVLAPVNVNCTGLGAAELFGDEQLVPVKGQLTVLFPQPEVDYIAIQRGLYLFPQSDGILLGGTFERGNASLDVDPEAERRIVEGHRRLFAGMRTAGAVAARA